MVGALAASPLLYTTATAPGESQVITASFVLSNFEDLILARSSRNVGGSGDKLNNAHNRIIYLPGCEEKPSEIVSPWLASENFCVTLNIECKLAPSGLEWLHLQFSLTVL